MTEKLTGIPELDLAIRALENQFSKNLVGLGPRVVQVETFPSGSIYLDARLGTGGFPQYGIVEVFGHESSGKTGLVLQLARQYRNHYGSDRKILFLDLERTTGLNYMQSMGLDPGEILYSWPDTAEEALNTAENLATTGKVGLVILDSVDGLVPRAALDRDIGDTLPGLQAKIMSEAMRRLSKLAADKQVLILFVNQTRSGIGPYAGKITSGGNALRFYAQIRIKVHSRPNGSIPGACDMKITIEKNKYASLITGEFPVLWMSGKGVDPYRDLINYAKDIGIMYFGGQWCMVVLPGEEKQKLCGGGVDGATAFLAENPEWYDRLRQACLQTTQPQKKGESPSGDVNSGTDP